MQYDYVIGIDPGYATLGVSILDLRGGRPEFVHMSSALTAKTVVTPTKEERASMRKSGATYPIADFQEREESFYRIGLMVSYLRSVIKSVCNPIFKLKALVVMEDWIVNPRARYVKTIYYRGAADLAVRLMLEMYGAHVLSVDPTWVNQFSNGQGKRTRNAENPTPMEILLYLEMSCPWLKNFNVQQWLEHRGTATMLNGSRAQKQKRVPEAAKLHYADAAVMTSMGVIALDTSLAAGRPPNQLEKASYLWERLQEIWHDLRQRSDN